MKNTLKISLNDPNLSRVLGTLHKKAESDSHHMKKIIKNTILKILTGRKKLSVLSHQPTVRAEILKNIYLPVCEDLGYFLYITARIKRAENIVEFGTSFGISTLYLAAALKDNGRGHLITTELEKNKVIEAQKNVDEAGLSSFVTILPGNALSTLKSYTDKIDLLFLDGWKDLYLPLLQMLESRLAPGSVILADDAVKFKSRMKSFFNYIKNPENGYTCIVLPIGDGILYALKN